MRRSAIPVPILVALSALARLPAQEAVETPVAGEEIRIGITAALSGPTKSVGLAMKRGLEAQFHAINGKGGIDGRRLRLVALDDGYTSGQAAENMRRLIDEEKVLAMAGNVGTPTAEVTLPIANAKRTLLLGAFTGAPLLRKSPPDRYVVNYRASYAEETGAMVEALLAAGIRPFEIAIFSQKDSYGDAGHAGVVMALEKAGYRNGKELVHGRYEHNTTAVEDAVLDIVESRIRPRAIIMVGAYRPGAKFIRIAKRSLPRALYLNVSFVGSAALARELGEIGEGVIVTQTVPHYKAGHSLVRDYRASMGAVFPDEPLGFVSLEGFVVGRILAEGLGKVTGEPTRESLVDALQGLGDFDIGLGTRLRLDERDRQASREVWPTQLREGEFVPIEWTALKQGAPTAP